MCGIFGFTSVSDESTLRSQFISSLKHRGPDGEGVVNVDAWTLGHLRLAILDTSDAAQQPMAQAASVIAFNGEIYNYLELRGEYVSGIQLESTSDTEVLISLLNLQGIKCLNKLNGMFAFAWYCKKTKNLYLVRDRFGVKPLYWMKLEDKFYFSSEISTLASLQDNLSINDECLNAFMRDTATDYDQNTMLTGIFQVQPGHYLQISENLNITNTKWYLGNDHDVDMTKLITQQARDDYFEDLLTDAIKLRLRSDVPVCLTLSGGLDSSLIYVLAKERLGANVKPFSFVHIGKNTDESEKVSKLVAGYGDTFCAIQSDHELGSKDVIEAARYLEYPIWNSSAVAYLDMYKAIQKSNFKVVLEGHGSDEILGGYPYMVEAACREHFSKAEFALAFSAFITYQNTLHQGVNKKAHSKYCSTYLLKLFIKGILDTFKNQRFQFQECLRESRDYKILPIVLRAFDRLSMSQSVESRAPFMDYRVIEFAQQLTPNDLITPLGNKSILRRILKKYNKNFIFEDKVKLGFSSDLPSFFSVKDTKDFFKKKIEMCPTKYCGGLKETSLSSLSENEIDWSKVNVISKLAGIQMMLEQHGIQ